MKRFVHHPPVAHDGIPAVPERFFGPETVGRHETVDFAVRIGTDILRERFGRRKMLASDAVGILRILFGLHEFHVGNASEPETAAVFEKFGIERFGYPGIHRRLKSLRGCVKLRCLGFLCPHGKEADFRSGGIERNDGFSHGHAAVSRNAGFFAL